MEQWTRRRFFLTSLAGSAAAGAIKLFGNSTAPAGNGNQPPDRHADSFPETRTSSSAQARRPVIISSLNGLPVLDRGMDVLKKGGTRSMRFLLR